MHCVRRQMRKTALSLALALLLWGAFSGGYYYRAIQTPASAEMEDYALSNLFDNIAYVHFLSKGDYESMRSMLDLTLDSHLSRVRAHSGGVTDTQFDESRTRTLNALAVIWDRFPPFQSHQWEQSETNSSWWSEWSAKHKQNLALLQEAKAKCAAMPALNCKAQPPSIRLPVELK